jgi:hypothetical protein
VLAIFSKGVLSAPISRTDTIKPSSPALGSSKYSLKYGPVMMPDMTLEQIG